jgi:uncharacterized membrane protein YfcA
LNLTTRLLLFALLAVAATYVVTWSLIERRRRRPEGKWPRGWDVVTGFVTNFFDTLGIGCFAPTTAIFKMFKRVPDEEIPGTLNSGHGLPAMTEAFIFIAAITVDPLTLVGMIVAASLGAWFGAGIVSGLPRRGVQLGMGSALLIAAGFMLASNLHLMPGGGEALGLSGGRLAFAVAMNFLFGALMTFGVGLYAPCLILVCLLGMSPITAFPIMMGSCAFLMPVGALRFVREARYSVRAAVSLALGGIPGVFLAAPLVKKLSVDWLRWLVVCVVLYAASLMLTSAWRAVRHRPASAIV